MEKASEAKKDKRIRICNIVVDRGVDSRAILARLKLRRQIARIMLGLEKGRKRLFGGR